jgi:hypothetical protein
VVQIGRWEAEVEATSGVDAWPVSEARPGTRNARQSPGVRRGLDVRSMPGKF